MNKKNSFEDLYKNKEFIQKVILQKNEDDVKKLFAEKGVEITQQELSCLKEAIQLILGKKQKLSDVEIKSVAGGIPPQAMHQLSAALFESLCLFLRSNIESMDPTRSVSAIRILEENPSNPNNLSWIRVATNAINGTLDLDPRLREAANSLLAWWNK